VTGGWLEHEVRSLPQVLACSIDQDDVVVLVQPSADPVAIERAVTALLVRAGVDLPVRVFGGSRPVFVEPARIRSGRPALIGSVGGALVLAAGIWLAGATTGLRPTGGARSKAPLALLAPPLAKELVTVHAGSAPAEEPPAPPDRSEGPLLRPTHRPILNGHGGNGGTGDNGGSGGTPQPVDLECNAPHAGQDPTPFPGRGNGPPAWSHSIHVPAHCGNGRP